MLLLFNELFSFFIEAGTVLADKSVIRDNLMCLNEPSVSLFQSSILTRIHTRVFTYMLRGLLGESRNDAVNRFPRIKPDGKIARRLAVRSMAAISRAYTFMLCSMLHLLFRPASFNSGVLFFPSHPPLFLNPTSRFFRLEYRMWSSSTAKAQSFVKEWPGFLC